MINLMGPQSTYKVDPKTSYKSIHRGEITPVKPIYKAIYKGPMSLHLERSAQYAHLGPNHTPQSP